MKTIDNIVATALHTADADQRCIEADAQFATEFVALDRTQQAARWRGLDHGAKFRLVVRRIEALGKTWEPSIVEEFISKYDVQFAASPVDAAVEGALERLAIQHADAGRLADATGDKAHRKAERAAATAFGNALIQYRAGVRPQQLPSGAYLLPSRRFGEAPHIIRMDGDWICSCCAGAAWHWPLALIIGIEQAIEDMAAFDDGDTQPADLGRRIAEARERYEYAA